MTNWFKSHGTESLKDFCVFESDKFGYEHLQMASYYEAEWTHDHRVTYHFTGHKGNDWL